MNLNDIISASTLKGIGQKTNATPEQVKRVLTTALPIMVQSMAKNAKNEEGAQSLAKAFAAHANFKADASLKNVDPADGVKILKHVLGSDVKAANKSIAKQSGVSASTAAGILAMAAPLLMQVLGKETETSQTSASGISKLLLSLLKAGGSGSGSLLGTLLGNSDSANKEDDENDLLGNLLGAFTNDDDDDEDDESILSQVGSLAANLAGSGSSGKKDGDNGLAGLLLTMLKSK
ncbi:MAG: DUF937 domain-containing protein [Candidatus Pelethousia sp.]|nr:DUF937 domain-containing protein [Candidatus Pelethousia sp.]